MKVLSSREDGPSCRSLAMAAKRGVSILDSRYAVSFSSPSAIRRVSAAVSATIQLGLRCGRNAGAIWKDLVFDHGFLVPG